MKFIGILLILGSFVFIVPGCVGTIAGAGVENVFQQQTAGLAFVAGIIMLVGGFLLFALGDVCNLLKEIKDKSGKE